MPPVLLPRGDIRMLTAGAPLCGPAASLVGTHSLKEVVGVRYAQGPPLITNLPAVSNHRDCPSVQ